MKSEETLKELAKNSGKKYGGKLKDWSVHKTYRDIKFVQGRMDGVDPTHRFRNNDIIRTSDIVWLEADHDYVETANTIYKLVGEESDDPVIPDYLIHHVYFD